VAFSLSVFVQTGPQLSFDFTNTTGLWQQLGQDIDGEAVDDGSGESVSLSADGLTVTIGAPENDGNGGSSGHTRIYRFTPTHPDVTDKRFYRFRLLSTP